jgi:hypothetical protein
MAIELTDDGTMDTVLRCSECGEEFRFNYDCGSDDDDDDRIAATIDANPGISTERATELVDEIMYDEFIDQCIAETEAEHECSRDDEPAEGDITTADHETFYQYGKVVLETARSNRNASTWFGYDNGKQFVIKADDYRAALRLYMDRVQFWPNVFSISDHGNAHLIDLGEK